MFCHKYYKGSINKNKSLPILNILLDWFLRKNKFDRLLKEATFSFDTKNHYESLTV